MKYFQDQIANPNKDSNAILQEIWSEWHFQRDRNFGNLQLTKTRKRYKECFFFFLFKIDIFRCLFYVAGFKP